MLKKKVDIKLLQTIQDIPKDDRENVIVIGRGPSVDNLILDELNSQKKYDLAVINDAIKLITRPKFSIHFHIQSILRSQKVFDRAKYILLSTKILWQAMSRGEFDLYYKIKKMKNAFFFYSASRDFDFILNGDFPLKPQYRLYHYKAAVNGLVYFLAGRMNYKNFRFIGFDGGTKYGGEVDDSRRLGKIYNAQLNYLGSWLATKTMLKIHYPDCAYGLLEEFIIDQPQI